VILANIISNNLLLIFYYIVLTIVVLVVTKIFKFSKSEIFLINTRKSALWAVGVITLIFALIGIISFLIYKAGAERTNNSQVFTFNSALQMLFLVLIVYSPIFISIRKNKEPIKSIGISKLNLFSSLLLGVLLIIIIGSTVKFYKPDLSLTMSSSRLWGLVYFTIVGFGEEIVFRGYLQTRLVLWLGALKGWVISSITMALMHLWQRVFIMQLTLSGALLNIFFLLLPSFFLGYLMLRTKNVVAPGLVHTFMDWFLLFL
jgi:membrane protease YdiL (CAAX protease family)